MDTNFDASTLRLGDSCGILRVDGHVYPAEVIRVTARTVEVRAVGFDPRRQTFHMSTSKERGSPDPAFCDRLVSSDNLR